MRLISIRNPVPRVLWFLVVAVAGCGPAPSTNLSPTSEQDPARYERAVRDAEGKARKDQEAERKAFQSKGQAGPNL